MAKHNTLVPSPCSDDPKSKTSLTGAKSTHQLSCVLLEARGQKLFPCLFQLPEAVCIP